MLHGNDISKETMGEYTTRMTDMTDAHRMLLEASVGRDHMSHTGIEG
jgi:hypothetical protein